MMVRCTVTHNVVICEFLPSSSFLCRSNFALESAFLFNTANSALILSLSSSFCLIKRPLWLIFSSYFASAISDWNFARSASNSVSLFWLISSSKEGLEMEWKVASDVRIFSVSLIYVDINVQSLDRLGGMFYARFDLLCSFSWLGQTLSLLTADQVRLAILFPFYYFPPLSPINFYPSLSNDKFLTWSFFKSFSAFLTIS